MSRALVEAVNGAHEAKKNVGNILRRDYPVGAEAAWMRGKHTCRGRVVAHGYRDRVKVKNDLRDSEYWISAWDIADYEIINADRIARLAS